MRNAEKAGMILEHIPSPSKSILKKNLTRVVWEDLVPS